MNTPEQHDEQTAEHEGLIKTPKQLIVTILLSFAVPIVVILLLIRLVTASSPLGAGSDGQTQEAIASRIQPVAGFSLVSADAATEERTGEQVYAATCAACHTAGIAGAPKLGDSAAWGPLVAKGYDNLLNNAIHGVNAMPPRGGNPALSDLEVARAVVYLANESGASFPEPAAEGDGAPEAPAAEQADAQAEQAAAADQGSAPAAEQTAQAQEAAAQAEQTAQVQEAVAEGEQAAQAEDATQAAQAAAEASAAQSQSGAAPQQDGAAAAAAADVDLAAGEKIYKTTCFACHDAGVAGAPKFGDAAAWKPLIAQGMDTLYQSSIHGKGIMPPRGGSNASDEEIIAAVHYMVNAAQ